MLKVISLKVAMATGEPAQSFIGAVAAGLSAGALSLFGVSYFGILWALFGALVGVMFSPPQDRKQVLAAVIGGTLMGAVLGDLGMALLLVMVGDTSVLKALPDVTKGLHLGVSFIIGAGAKLFLGAMLSAIVNRITKAGGQA